MRIVSVKRGKGANGSEWMEKRAIIRSHLLRGGSLKSGMNKDIRTEIKDIRTDIKDIRRDKGYPERNN
jgi:hypothetical protein